MQIYFVDNKNFYYVFLKPRRVGTDMHVLLDSEK